MAAWNFLTAEKGFAGARTFIYGHSLGGAIAIDLAKRVPEASGLITECTFTSALDISRLKYNGWLRFLPMDSLLQQRFESLEKTATPETPVLLIHGIADQKIPCALSRQLDDAANSPKGLLLIEGGTHSNCSEIENTRGRWQRLSGNISESPKRARVVAVGRRPPPLSRRRFRASPSLPRPIGGRRLGAPHFRQSPRVPVKSGWQRPPQVAHSAEWRPNRKATIANPIATYCA